MNTASNDTWLAWFDTDFVVMNEDIAIEALIGTAVDIGGGDRGDDDIAVVFARDEEGLNAGALLWRVNARGVTILDDWLALFDVPTLPTGIFP